MKDEFVKNIGIWGQRHYNYLKKSNPTVVNVMRMKGTLEQYLTDLNRTGYVRPADEAVRRYGRCDRADKI